MEWTKHNSNSMSVRSLHKEVAVNTALNRMMSEDDFQMVVEYMVEKGFAQWVESDKLYVYSISITEIGDQLNRWAEEAGVVDQAEFSLIDDLYEMKARSH